MVEFHLKLFFKFEENSLSHVHIKVERFEAGQGKSILRYDAPG